MPGAKKAGRPTKKAAPRSGATARATRATNAGGGSNRTERHKVALRQRAQKATRITGAMLALTAAAEVLDSAGKNKTADPNSATRTWQHAATGYCRVVPELNAAKMYYGNCLARVQLKVGKRNPDGTVEQGFDGAEPVEGLDKQLAADAAEIINTIRSKIGGQSELLRSYGEKAFVSGESYLLPEDSPAGLTFDVLSTQELSKSGDKWIRHLGPGFGEEDVADGVLPLRIWRPDDTYGRLATSSVRACLEILEELVILTRLVRSSAICRMALQGILAISDEFDDPIDEGGEDGSEDANPLATDMIMSGATAIDDPASAAAWLPYILQGPTELIEKGIKFIQFKGDDAVNVVKRREALERLAQGLDLPMEIVLGHQSTTFANAAQISEDTFKVHIEPSVQMFCDAITLGILWPALALKRGLDAERVKEAGYPPEILAVAVTYDASDLISRPDRAKDIIQVFTRDQTHMAIAVGDVRLALGLDVDGVPSPQETAARIDAIRLTKIRETVQDPASAGATPILADISQMEGAGVTASISNGVGLAHQVAGAAAMTMDRAADKVGSKLRSKLKGAEATAAKSVENGDLALHLGPARVRDLLGDDDPAAAEIATFSRTVAKMAGEAGRPHPGKFAELAGQLVSVSIADRLYARHDVVKVADIEALAFAGAMP